MSELEETKFWVALTKLQAEVAEINLRITKRLEEITVVQLDTDQRLRQLTMVVHDLATIVAAHERRLDGLES